jgi:hypothetical protein
MGLLKFLFGPRDDDDKPDNHSIYSDYELNNYKKTYGLDDDEMDVVRRGDADPWDFDEDSGDYDEDSYYDE